MVLPLLLSLGLPALAGSGALGATLAGFGVPALAGIGAGLGSFVQTGDLGKGIQTGLTSFLGGKILGGLSGSTSTNALNAGNQGVAAVPKPGFLQSALGPSQAAKSIVAGPSSGLVTNFLGAESAGTALPFGSTTGATKGGALTAAQQGFMPGMIGQTMTDAQVAQKEYENRAAKKKAGDTTIPMPNAMRRTYNPNPYANGGGEGSYFNYQRPARFDGSQVQAPYTYAGGGVMSFQEGGGLSISEIADKAMEMFGDASQASIEKVMSIFNSYTDAREEGIKSIGRGLQKVGSYSWTPYALKGMGFDNAADVMGYPFDDDMNMRPQYKAEGGEMEADQMMAQSGMNEKDVIVSAVEAIKGMSEQPEIVLALFVQKYGEEALRDLVGRVQSGELDDTVQRFEEGDKGMVRGPGDGSGVDDMVPATLEGEQDVLLSDGEFVLRKNTTDALEKAYGGGFLDVVNRAEEDAPEKLQQMVG
tara:strand:+ start:388 stop:1812 length:1425 start_codon:yes stop_codon:yes gene_type:complete